jgi:hypothetical protein
MIHVEKRAVIYFSLRSCTLSIFGVEEITLETHTQMAHNAFYKNLLRLFFLLTYVVETIPIVTVEKSGCFTPNIIICSENIVFFNTKLIM